MRKTLPVVAALSLIHVAQAQTCDQWATGNEFAAHGGRIGDSILFDDGAGPALYVAGAFDGLAPGVNAIAKWNGASFVAVGGEVPGTGAALAIYDEDGPGPAAPALFLTGSFQTAGGVSVHNIARWDGSAWSALGPGLSSNATALAVYDDGQGPALIAGGYFTTTGGAAANHLAAWRAGAWTELGGGVTGNASVPVSVKALAVFNGALYVGGSFVTAGTTSVTSIAKRQNGAWSRPGTLGNAGGFYPDVQHLLPVDLSTTNGPALIAAGVFNAGTAYIIAAWNGSAWSGLGVTSTTNSINPSGLGLYDAGSGPQLLASGLFGQSSGLIGWNGTSWEVVAPAQGDRVGGINTMTQTGPGVLFVGGSVTQIQGLPVAYAATLHNGSVTPMGGFGRGFDSSVYALQMLDAGDGPHLYAAGAFRVADGQICPGIARRVGNAWVPLATTLRTNNNEPGTIRAIAAFDDGSGPALYAAGSFLTINGVAALNVARWRPATGWEAVGGGLNNFASPTISSGGVYALAVHNDSAGASLCAAGSFTYTGTTSGLARVARWSGSAWLPLGAGVGTSISYPLAMASFDEDGPGPQSANLWVGGRTGLLKRWDGVSWTTPSGAPTANSVSALLVTDATGVPAMYAGGDFAAPFHTSVVRLTNGQWEQVGQTLLPNFVFDADAQPGAASFALIDGAPAPGLCVGGSFYDPTNYAVFNFAVLQDQLWTPIQGGLNGNGPAYSGVVRALAASGQQFWAGGSFSRYYFNGPDIIGAPSTNIASVTTCRRCTADVDGDGDVATDADIEAFFACLAGNCCPACTADFNADGDVATDADIESFFRVLAGGHC